MSVLNLDKTKNVNPTIYDKTIIIEASDIRLNHFPKCLIYQKEIYAFCNYDKNEDEIVGVFYKNKDNRKFLIIND